MHVVIINGSPRVQKFSNTDKIITSFAKGLVEAGASYEVYSISNRNEWDAARNAFISQEHIIIALPLYVECVSSLLLEFLETIPVERQKPAQLSFILHGGFTEGHQLRLGERFLQSLPAQLGCTYGGCLTKGGSFFIRFTDEKPVQELLNSYIPMGRMYVEKGNFYFSEATKFTGPEYYPLLIRWLIEFMFKVVANKKFDKYAHEWGCTLPLDNTPY